MTDERAYRGDEHPPTCICVDCEFKHAGDGVRGWFKRKRTLVVVGVAFLIILTVAIVTGVLI